MKPTLRFLLATAGVTSLIMSVQAATVPPAAAAQVRAEIQLPAEALEPQPDPRPWTEKVVPELQARAAQTTGNLDCIIVFRKPTALADALAFPPGSPTRLKWIASTADTIDREYAGVGVRTLTRYAYLPMAHVTIPASMLAAIALDPRVDAITMNRTAHVFRAPGEALIHVPQVQALGYTGQGIGIAVLDTGVDYTHPELSPGGTTAAAKTVKLADVIDNDGDPMDEEGHGTSVAGIAAGSSGGVAPAARIVAVRVLDKKGIGSSDQILTGINDVIASVSNGNPFDIVVVNLSLGGYFQNQPTPPPQPCDADVPDFASAFQTLNNAGVLVVVASGNGGCTSGVAWPACVSQAMAVGAVYTSAFAQSITFPKPTDGCATTSCSDSPAADKVACYDDSGPELDVWAPGHLSNTPTLAGHEPSVTECWLQDTPRYDACFGGTSAAAPYVSGVAALLTQAVPGRTVAALRNAIKSTGNPVTDSRNSVTRNSIRADAALTALQTNQCTAPTPPTGLATDTSSFCSGQSFTLSWSAVSGAASYTVQLASDAAFTSLISLTPSTFTSSPVSISLTGSQAGTVYARVRANASCGASSSYSSTVQLAFTGTCGTVTYTNAYWVSSVAHTPGFAPAYWYSDLAVFNPSSSTAQVLLTYNGSVALAPVTSSIGALQQVTWKDVLTSAFGLAGTDVGDILVQSTQSLIVQTRTYSETDPTQPTFGASVIGLDTSHAISQGQVGYFTNLRSDGNFRTNVEALNTSSVTASVEVRFFTNGGVQIGSPVTFSVDPYKRNQVNMALPSGQTSAYGVIRVLNAGPKILALASVVDGGSGDPTTVEMVVP